MKCSKCGEQAVAIIGASKFIERETGLLFKNFLYHYKVGLCQNHLDEHIESLKNPGVIEGDKK